MSRDWLVTNEEKTKLPIAIVPRDAPLGNAQTTPQGFCICKKERKKIEEPWAEKKKILDNQRLERWYYRRVIMHVQI
mgnify:CR=1 FL=1